MLLSAAYTSLPQQGKLPAGQFVKGTIATKEFGKKMVSNTVSMYKSVSGWVSKK